MLLERINQHSESDQRFLIKDVKGIKVAIMGYTEHLNGLDSQYSAEEIDSMVNTIDERTDDH